MIEKNNYIPRTFAEFFARHQWIKFEADIQNRYPILDNERGLLQKIFEAKVCVELANGATFWDAVSAGFYEINKVLEGMKNENNKR